MIKKEITKTYNLFGKDLIPQNAVDQFEKCMIMPFSVKGAIMPDSHLGYSMPIGGVIATKGVIVPAWVGFDIGCGVTSYETNFTKDMIVNSVLDFREMLFNELTKRIPVGNGDNFTLSLNSESLLTDALEDLNKKNKITLKNANDEDIETLYKKHDAQLGTLGSGNHFVEIGYSLQTQRIWISVHSGSRGFGWNIANHYMKQANLLHEGNEKGTSDNSNALPTNSALGKSYIKDLYIAQNYALINRELMVSRALHAIKAIDYSGDTETIIQKKSPDNTYINKHHNHAEYDKTSRLWIHRKGATQSYKDMLGVIPANMRDGVYIVKGLGNENSLCSSSHGAGRVGSRKEARESTSMKDFNLMMGDVKCNITKSTLDENPNAYKDIDSVLNEQRELIDIVDVIKPLINLKG